MTYTAATASDLKTRYPAFAAVEDATVTYWLDDARTVVTSAWIEGDRAKAEMALAAHNMALGGLGTGSGGATGDMTGVTDFKSASFAVSFDAETVRKAAAGGYDATRYGVEYKTYLRRNRGGPTLVPAVPACNVPPCEPC